LVSLVTLRARTKRRGKSETPAEMEIPLTWSQDGVLSSAYLLTCLGLQLEPASEPECWTGRPIRTSTAPARPLLLHVPDRRPQHPTTTCPALLDSSATDKCEMRQTHGHHEACFPASPTRLARKLTMWTAVGEWSTHRRALGNSHALPSLEKMLPAMMP
jgi:hypothetical protein